MLHLKGLSMKDHQPSHGDLYFGEILRIEARRVPFFIFWLGVAGCFGAAAKVHHGGHVFVWLVTLALAVAAIIAGAAIMISDVFERRYFIRKSLGDKAAR
jgi:hypothetical protein